MLVQGRGVKPVGIRSGLPDLMLLKSTPKHYYEAQMLKRRGLAYEMTDAQVDAGIMFPAWQRQGDRACGGCGNQVATPSRLVVRPDPHHHVFAICPSCSVGSDAEVVQRVRRRLQQQANAAPAAAASTTKAPLRPLTTADQPRIRQQRLRADLARRRAQLAQWALETEE